MPRGWQQEYWIENDPERLPMALVHGPDGGPLTITVPTVGARFVRRYGGLRSAGWRCFCWMPIGPRTGCWSGWITSQLYVGDPVTRLSQYALLGVGGIRALEAMGIEPTLVHLNEGHAAFAVLKLAREEVARGVPVEDALAAARARTVFTTHTPVGAGNYTYSREDVIATLGGVIAELGAEPEAIVRLARQHPPDSSRAIWRDAVQPPDEPGGECGQPSARGRGAGNVVGAMAGAGCGGRADHARHERGASCDLGGACAMHCLLDRHLGEDWWRRASDIAIWEVLDGVSDAELWEARCEQRAELVAFVKERSGIDRLA